MTAALLLWLGLWDPAPRAVLQTRRGSIVIRFEESSAPRNARKIQRLIELGAYDGTFVYNIIAGGHIHLAGASYNGRSLTAEQLAAAVPLPVEAGALKHRAGTVTIAHTPGRADPTQSSLVFLLTDSPHLDGRFSAIGTVETPWVLKRLSGEPVEPDGMPITRIEVTRGRLARPVSRGAAAAVAVAAVLAVLGGAWLYRRRRVSLPSASSAQP